MLKLGMIRTLLGMGMALILSATLLASPCVLCFKAPPPDAHACCDKSGKSQKQTRATEECGLLLSDLNSSDLPTPQPAAIGLSHVPGSLAVNVVPAPPVSPAVPSPGPLYAPPPLHLLNSTLLI